MSLTYLVENVWLNTAHVVTNICLIFTILVQLMLAYIACNLFYILYHVNKILISLRRFEINL